MSSDDMTPPNVPVQSARKSLLERVSVVWIVPLLALVIVLAVAWHSYVDRGPVIEITFGNATGVRAEQTELRYRDVVVGLVEDVSFTESLAQVLVTVRLQKNVAAYVDQDARFWVVRPEVTAQGVSGLGTVLTGVFIEGLWDEQPGGLATRFDGLADAPLDRLGREGLHLILRAAGDAVMTENAPILYRGIEVGRVGQTRISDDGTTAEAEALIFSPHDRLITGATRFWDASGFSFTLGPAGASIDFSSLASLLSGGLSFETLVSGGGTVSPNDIFTVYTDEAEARSSVFSGEESQTLNLTAVFDENVAGLTADAAVTLGGLQIGQVSALNGVVDPDRFGDDRVRLTATLAIRPSRLGLEDGGSPEAALDFLRQRVADGLRARLVTASVLTGGLKVELKEEENAPPREIDMSGDPNPIIPTAPSLISDVSATAEGVFERINNLPIEELLKNATLLLQNANALIATEDVRAMPGNLNGLFADARDVVTSDDVQALPGRLTAVVDQLEATLAQVNDERLAARLGAAVDNASAAARGVETSVAGVPDLIARLDAIAENVEKVRIEALASELQGLVASASALLSGAEVQAIPGNVNGLLSDARGVVTSAEVQALPGRLTAVIDRLEVTLAQVNEERLAARLGEAVDNASAAARGVETSVAGVPDLVARLDAIAAKAEAADIGQLATELQALLATADRLIGSADTQAVPGHLNDALDEVRAVLAELRDGGLVENANATLASARGAADRIAEVSRDLPGLIARAEAVLAQAGDTLRGYEANTGLGRDARSALREVQRAAEAVAALARKLERSPNSILTGK